MDEISTIQEWLDAAGFSWGEGIICYHPTMEDEEDDELSPGWSNLKGEPKTLKRDDAILLKQFNDGFGGPECPRFYAVDNEAIYFPWQYDGSTGLQKVFKTADRYLSGQEQTPYPGK